MAAIHRLLAQRSFNVQRRGLSAEMIMQINLEVPKNGRAVPMRNDRTGAAWLVSFDYRDGTYWHEPQGNLRNIRRPLSGMHDVRELS